MLKQQVQKQTVQLLLQSQAFATARRAVASSGSDSIFVSIAAEEEEKRVVRM